MLHRIQVRGMEDGRRIARMVPLRKENPLARVDNAIAAAAQGNEEVAAVHADVRAAVEGSCRRHPRRRSRAGAASRCYQQRRRAEAWSKTDRACSETFCSCGCDGGTSAHRK
mmetsp:Transcript_4689/g.10609  ORF Transcript_4689/g.10609 Transcript_4689/m.10609 type:complete len:112 (-) Transcript_4689:476-811(-)